MDISYTLENNFGVKSLIWTQKGIKHTGSQVTQAHKHAYNKTETDPEKKRIEVESGDLRTSTSIFEYCLSGDHTNPKMQHERLCINKK